MCGICGIFSDQQKYISRDTLLSMTETLGHRGPDDSSTVIFEGLGIGHTRLSIIDLEGGSQPIYNEDGSLCIVFNGEIYNYIELRSVLIDKGHKFKTNSDTEVILHSYEEWGTESIKKLNGIFAFAIWNDSEKTLLLARDHLGVKPLYYVHLMNRFIFASEIKSLLKYDECPREVDIYSLAELFTFRYVPSPKTMFKNIFKLPPGHFMIMDPNNTIIERFWTYTPIQTHKTDPEELIYDYQVLLEDAVKLQLRSDVPVGLFLSSGVDSGSLLAIMAQNNVNPLHTFTIGFEDGYDTDETHEARMIAREFGSDHHEMTIMADDYMDYYERYLYDIEEPVGNETAAAFYFVSKLASKHVKVALSGQGADEPWAGYDRHLGAKLSSYYTKLPNFITEGFYKSLTHLIPRNEKLKRAVYSLAEPDVLSRFVKIYSFYTEEMKDALFSDWVKHELTTLDYDPKRSISGLFSDVSNKDTLTQMLYLDTRTNLPDDLLMVGDKTSMANSIEARVPFLDYRLVEFIESLPENMKLRGLNGKYLHKKALEKWLPKEVINRKKKGFASPVNNWLRTKMLEYVNECLLSEDSATGIYFDKKFIKNLIVNHQSGKEEYIRHIYLLINFELWHRTFIG